MRGMWRLHHFWYRVSGGRVGCRRWRAFQSFELTTKGRTSGKARSVLLTYLEDPRGFIVIASNAGDRARSRVVGEPPGRSGRLRPDRPPRVRGAHAAARRRRTRAGVAAGRCGVRRIRNVRRERDTDHPGRRARSGRGRPVDGPSQLASRERREHGVVHKSVRRNQAPAVDRRRAVGLGHAPSRLGHDHDERCEVPLPQLGFDHDLCGAPSRPACVPRSRRIPGSAARR